MGWRLEVRWGCTALKRRATSSLLIATVKENERLIIQEIVEEEEKKEAMDLLLQTGRVLLQDKLFLGNPTSAATLTKVTDIDILKFTCFCVSVFLCGHAFACVIMCCLNESLLVQI